MDDDIDGKNVLENSVLEELLDLVGPSLHGRSGSVFYSGRRAFSKPSKLYFLGLNPGGSPEAQASETIGMNIERARSRVADDWSEYRDECWLNHKAGTYGMQPRVCHLFEGLGMEPGEVPSSNVIFVRTATEQALAKEKETLLSLCWPVHAGVIARLEVRTIVCCGRTAGRWVRENVGAQRLLGSCAEKNCRGWKSTAHESDGGFRVITLTHPGRANWMAPKADPTAFVKEYLR